jgi:site-specific DNA-cytosine methylase
MMTMGSLFDGIGGFPLVAVRNGIIPLWASEIEAFPIEVTKIRFPEMLHVGDITKLDGAAFPDGWTLIPGASDSARYKALGNSVAIPCVDFVLRGIAYFLRKIHEEQEESPPCISTPTT